MEASQRSGNGLVLIAFDGSPASEHAVRQAGGVLGRRRALVVVVYKQGVGFELLELPTATLGLPPAPLDVRTAMEIDREQAERAQRLAQRGAQLAGEAGFDAEPLTVAEDLDITVAETICTIAQERDAQVVVLGAHGHGRISEAILGSVSRDVIRRATRPVLVVRRAQDQPA